MDVKLTIYSDDKQYFSQAISLPCVIGRARQCGVAIVHPVVSRRHCEIYEDNGQVCVRDLGSLNGTVFQGMRIGRGIHIPYGSFFSIGRLFFMVESAEESSFVSESSEQSEEQRDDANDRVAVDLEKDDRSNSNESPKFSFEKDPFAVDDEDAAPAPIDLDDLASEAF